MKSAIITMQRDVAPYLAEWACYHKLTGWDHILFYDNESSDGTAEVAMKLEREGILSYMGVVKWREGEPNLQPTVVNMGIQAAKALGCDWVAIVDDDEFIEVTAAGCGSIDCLLSRAGARTCITANWLWHGEATPGLAGGVLERVQHRSHVGDPDNRWVKSIFRPEFYHPSFGVHLPGYPIESSKCLAVHDFVIEWPEHPTEPMTKRPRYNFLCWHHYKYRSAEEFARQSKRAYPGDPGPMSRNYTFDPARYQVLDLWALDFIPQLYANYGRLLDYWRYLP